MDGTEVILVSDSDPDPDPKWWIEERQLYERDRAVLRTAELNDNIINAVQTLLSEQFSHQWISGYNS